MIECARLEQGWSTIWDACIIIQYSLCNECGCRYFSAPEIVGWSESSGVGVQAGYDADIPGKPPACHQHNAFILYEPVGRMPF